jgi:2-hydroxychromene-2-carboxylate isomerase
VIDELGHSGSEYLAWAGGEGADRFEARVAEGEADHIFGVPIFLFDGEPFWGHNRIPLLEERLTERGLRRRGDGRAGRAARMGAPVW